MGDYVFGLFFYECMDKLIFYILIICLLVLVFYEVINGFFFFVVMVFFVWVVDGSDVVLVDVYIWELEF